VARDFRTRLAKRAARIGLFLDEGLANSLTAYYELLARWNRKINLTSIENPDEAIDRLLLEPVLAARSLSLPAGPMELIDVGSGGGSPAIPLALALPSARLTMVEVKARKSAFLREAVRHLGLQGATVENARYEVLLASPGMLERFDLLSVRAVRIEPRILMTLQAFLKPGGQLLMFRGPSGPDEPAAVIHPLEWQATSPLIDVLQSRLTVLRKRADGAAIGR
jgi:16S rRNA (guanine527-N7)-methyltransferase